MPAGNRTGPMGMGPMTGRAAGFCAGSGMPGFTNSAPRGGYGMGFGRGGGAGRGFGGGGRGWRHWFHATGMPGWMRFGSGTVPPAAPDPALEKQYLQQQAQALQAQIDQIRKRLDEIQPPQSV